MTSERQCPNVARYEATVSTGLEDIAQREIIDKLDAKTETSKGRVFLKTDRPVKDILKLKSINNLFVIIYDARLADEEIPQDAEQLESLLMKVGDQCDWRLGLSKWKEMSNFDKCDLDEILTKNERLHAVHPSFRVSSNRHGPKHKFTSPEICSIFGHVIDMKFGWPIKMKEFDLQVYANVNENHLYVALTLTPISLACRNIVATGYTTLKAATCYALLRVAKVKLGDIVLDPMAGSGAIPVENMVAWKDTEWFSFTLCSDITENILKKSKVNMDIFSAYDRVPPSDILKSDVTIGPLRDNSIDVIISDLPFGRRHGSKFVNRTLYPKMMLEMSRITRLDVGRAVLLTQDFKNMNLASEKTKSYWHQKLCTYVKIGNLDCWIYLFYRTDKPFVDNEQRTYEET